jgi:hypothetical protein
VLITFAWDAFFGCSSAFIMHTIPIGLMGIVMNHLTRSSTGVISSQHHVPVAQGNVATRLRDLVLSCPMTITPRAERWRDMAEGARAMADNMHDPDSKRMMLDIVASYEKLAEWAAKTNSGEMDC